MRRLNLYRLIRVSADLGSRRLESVGHAARIEVCRSPLGFTSQIFGSYKKSLCNTFITTHTPYAGRWATKKTQIC